MKQYAMSFACYISYGGWLIRMGRKRNVVPLFVVSNTSAYEEVIRVKCGCLVSYDYDGPGCGDENNLNAKPYAVLLSHIEGACSHLRGFFIRYLKSYDF